MSGSATKPGKVPQETKFANPALENIYARRSVRNYTTEGVSDDVVGEILRAGIYAPTAANVQPWRFVVIRNKEMIDRFGQRAKKLWLEQYKGSDNAHMIALSRTMARPEMDIFYAAPLLVLVFAAPEALNGPADIALAAENMMLAATALGLGSCWIGLAMPLAGDEEFRKEIGVPTGHTLVAPLIFGHPEKKSLRAPARNHDVILNWID